MRTEQLSIHKCAIELATLATRILPDMNRAHRGLIGKDIRDAAKAVIKNIRYANESRDQARVDYISAVLDLTESIVIDFRIAFELRLINRGIWSESIQLTGSLEKQAGGWRKASKNAPDAVGSRLQ